MFKDMLMISNIMIVEPYEKLENCETCEKPRFAKQILKKIERLD